MWEKFSANPTLFALRCDDEVFRAVAIAGITIGAMMLLRGAANVLMWVTAYFLYVSIVNLHSSWYSFGWETQMLETCTIWLAAGAPWLSMSRFPAGLPVPIALVLLHRWILFKIMIGAGLIKLRGDDCWRDWGEGGCMNFHYETQPNPHVLSRWFHYSPVWFHALELGANHFAELIAPWLLWLPRRARIAGGLIQLAFMGTIALSGNLAILNHLTAAPAIWCLDDACWTWAFSRGTVGRALAAEATKDGPESIGWPVLSISRLLRSVSRDSTPVPAVLDEPDHTVPTVDRMSQPASASGALRKRARGATEARRDAAGRAAAADAHVVAESTPRISQPWVTRVTGASFAIRSCWRWVRSALLLAAIVWLNAPVVSNLMSSNQSMNRSFGQWHLANTYGAFGSVHSVRKEMVVQGTAAADPTQGSELWREYEFICKPGALSRRPCTITPYHLRLDWLAWFAGSFYTYHQAPWVVAMVQQLLNEPRKRRLPVRSLQAGSSIMARTAHKGWVALNEHVLDRVAARDVRNLMSHDPFKGGPLPRWVRVEKYEYRWTPVAVARRVTALLDVSSSRNSTSLAITAESDPCASLPPKWGWLSAAAHKRKEKGKRVCGTATVLSSDDGSGHYLRAWPDGAGKGAPIEIGTWWCRRRVGEWLPPLDRSNPAVHDFLAQLGWAT